LGKEIERQWIGTRGSKFDGIREMASAVVEISQYYTAITKFDESRYRRVVVKVAGSLPAEKHFKTTKKGNGLSRVEEERPSTRKEYDFNKQSMVAGSIEIKKTRYNVPMHQFVPGSKLVAEVDVYESPELPGKIAVEVEFPTKPDAIAFAFPESFGDVADGLVDVTSDGRWKNKNVALHGFPA
jgi:CYTH domain-containing protein